MCTYNITLNDKLVDMARPAFSDDEDLQCWLEKQVSAALELFVTGNTKQHALVKDSMTTAFQELHSGQARKDARHLFDQQ
ncbi:MAG: hypothetical protein J5792_00430 [Bacteroidales bacterium]|nr:hypothetical protein [Bacteroidales bacterium]